MDFGTEEITTITDDNGSSVTLHRNYVRGDIIRPVKHYYAEKKRVRNQKEELEVILQFSDRIKGDPTMLDPQFKYEKSKLGDANGYYNVVLCYTKLEN